MAKSKIKAKTKAKSKTGIIPLGDKVLIKPLSFEEMGKKSPAGIIIPETVDRERADRGKVIAVGAGKRDEHGKLVPLEVKEGDTVIFQWGDKIEIDNEEYYVVSESGVLAIIK